MLKERHKAPQRETAKEDRWGREEVRRGREGISVENGCLIEV